MVTEQPLTIVIVGGVAGGASAATRARRLDERANIILLEKDEHVSFANCGLPYFIGDEIAEREQLLVASKSLLERRFLLDVRTRNEVEKIDREAKTVLVCDHNNSRSYEQPYDKLILSMGASPFVPALAGADAKNVFTLRNLVDADRIKSAVSASQTRQAVVVGASFIGLEMVEQLVHQGFQVSLAELQPQVLPPLDPEMVQPLEEELVKNDVRLFLGDGIKQVLVDDNKCASGVELQSGAVLDGDVVILGLGVRPNVQLGKYADLEIGSHGGIATNRYLQTSAPDIYAVGDVAEYHFGPTGTAMRIPLAGPANRAGRLAGEHAATGKSGEMADVFGTAIVRVFSKNAAITGLSKKMARQFGIATKSVTVLAGHHAGYFPGAEILTLQLIYAPDTGRLLGAQVVGGAGVDKRIDVVATALAMKATVHDLAGLDLAYAPPFGSAKDPIHLAAFAACNQMDGLVEFLDADTDLEGKQVLDVRSREEVARLPLANSDNVTNIPLDELRDRLGELDANADIVVSCGVGLRGHVALRILKQNGFEKAQNLSGGATMRNQATRRSVPFDSSLET